MKLSALERRAQRKARNRTMVDLNLVSLIDVFTILIFFLLSNTVGTEILPTPKGVQLPESLAMTSPHETAVIAITGSEIQFDGRTVATVDEVMRSDEPVIAALAQALQARAAALPAAPDAPASATDGAPAASERLAVTIMGDQTTPYQLLRKVMVSCATADFTNVAFAVRQKDPA